MNVSISGSGQIAPGEYEAVRISGSGKLSGLVRCTGFSSSGSSRGAELICKGAVRVSGSSSFTKGIRAETVSVTGSLDAGGDVKAEGLVDCSGSIECGGSLKCAVLRVSGETEVDGDVEAETVEIKGTLDCSGLLNAENILIKGSGMQIGSIGGSKIVICRVSPLRTLSKVPGLSFLVSKVTGKVDVPGGIEGDTVTLENVCTPSVSGRIVTIGKDCKIDLVQYSEELHTEPGAQIGRSEKV